MVSIDRERLRELIKTQGTTAKALSKALGTNDTLVRDILSGKSKNARGDTMAKIAAELGVDVSELLSGVEIEHRALAEASELPILGSIQAGAWLALDESGQDEPIFFSAVADRRYSHARQWLREVRGDSMNARGIVAGDLAHIVDLAGAGINLNTGMVVEVTRCREGRSLREITLKEVEITDHGITLWPRSTNPRWKDPIVMDDGASADIEIQVTGLLLQAIKRFL